MNRATVCNAETSHTYKSNGKIKTVICTEVPYVTKAEHSIGNLTRDKPTVAVVHYHESFFIVQ